MWRCENKNGLEDIDKAIWYLLRMRKRWVEMKRRLQPTINFDPDVNGVSQMKKRFSVTFLLTVEGDNNILSSYEESHEEDIYDMITSLIHDIDDTTLENLNVKERL